MPLIPYVRDVQAMIDHFVNGPGVGPIKPSKKIPATPPPPVVIKMVSPVQQVAEQAAAQLKQQQNKKKNKRKPIWDRV